VIRWREGFGWEFTGRTSRSPAYLCPDLLRYEQIGAADGLRGRVVRAFFWLMHFWPVPK
jgi:hypothetical protein